MDWSEERYVRVYTRDTADLLIFGWEGRLVWYELLRKVDRAGVLEYGGGDIEVVAELLRIPHEVFKVGIAKIAKREAVQITETAIVIPNFIEAQEASMSGNARQRESRLRRRDLVRKGIDPSLRETVIYFIQSEHGGPIKIGHAEDLAKRLVQIQTSRPDALCVLASVPGTVEQERFLHSRFAHLREKGEWFTATKELTEAVESLAGGLVTIDQVIDSHVTGHKTKPVTPSLAVPLKARADLSASPELSDARAHVSAPVDAHRAMADVLWADQEAAKAELRTAGVDPGSRGLGPVHPAKSELMRRLAEQAAEGRGLEVAMADCRHVLDVLLAEAKVSGSLRWLDGGHWKPDRFAAALSQSPGAARHRAKERREARAPGASPPPRPAINAVKPVEVSAEERAEAQAELGVLQRLVFGGGG